MGRSAILLSALALALPLLMGHSGCGSGETVLVSAEEKAIHAVLADSLDAMGIPGAIAAVAHPNGEIVTVAAGVARDTDISPETTFSLSRAIPLLFSPSPAWAGGRWSGVPATLTMHSRVGSVTKTFTAALILLLQEQGVVGLEDTVDQHLGAGFYPGGDKATLRQLLNMTAGFKNYTGIEAFLKRYLSDPTRTFQPRTLVEYARDSAVPNLFSPGQGWEYSNTNYVILGLVAEAATGQSYQELIRTKILVPLGLSMTSCPDTGDNFIPAPRMNGYIDLGSGWTDITEGSPSIAYSAGNMISTAGDLVLWLGALLDGQLLSAASKARMRTFVSREDGGAWDGSEEAYGLGLAYTKGAIGHEGEISGYQACCYKYRNRRFAVLINATPRNGEVDDIFWKVVRLYYPEAGN